MTIKEALEHLDAARIEWNEGYAYQKPRFEALDMAIEALKAREPRVMTWEEAKASVNDGPFIIFEVRDSTGSELDFGVLVDDSYEMSEGSLLTVELFPKMEDEYGKRFRMWTSRPTEAEREAVKWE